MDVRGPAPPQARLSLQLHVGEMLMPPAEAVVVGVLAAVVAVCVVIVVQCSGSA